LLEYLLLGGGFAFAAAVQPGPLQAYLFTRTAEQGWRRTLPASLSPLISDGPIALLVLLVLRRLPAGAGPVLQLAGGVLLLYLAGSAYRDWRAGPADTAPERAAVRRTLLQAAAVNLLNPNPYLGWSLVLGPAVLRAWREAPANAFALLSAFYGTMVVSLALTVLLFGTSRLLGPRGRRALVLASIVALTALGVSQIVSGGGRCILSLER
jgi:threonine/homoserine/homoserine lactone efflux protein